MSHRDRPDRQNSFVGQIGQAIGQITEISSNLVGPVIAGALLGYFLDRWLGTLPYLTLTLVFLGFLGGLWLTFRKLSAEEKKNGG